MKDKELFTKDLDNLLKAARLYEACLTVGEDYTTQTEKSKKYLGLREAFILFHAPTIPLESKESTNLPSPIPGESKGFVEPFMCEKCQEIVDREGHICKTEVKKKMITVYCHTTPHNQLEFAGMLVQETPNLLILSSNGKRIWIPKSNISYVVEQ